MLLYSKPCLYAIRALLYLALREDSGPCLAQEIADREGMPRHYLSKILKDLVSARILISNMGPGGGFVLRKDPSRLSLMQIVQVFDDIHTDLKSCAIGWARCSDEKPCLVHERFKPLREQIHQYLNETTLDKLVSADLLKNQAPS